MFKLNFRLTNILAILLISISFAVTAQDADWYTENKAMIDSIRKADIVIHVVDADGNPVGAEVSYKLVNHNFPWGTALASSNMNEDYWYSATARKYFNHAVTENAFKWSLMQPESGPVNYDDVNHYVEWCEQVGWEMRGHALLWGSKNYEDFHPLQKWVKDLPMPDMYDTLQQRVQRETKYYKGRIKEYDVMNEAVPGHASWLQETIGDSINWDSFKWAREVDPDAKLFINDYSIITGGSWEAYMKLIKEMLAEGAPIDGIGVQSHFGKGVVPRGMKYILDTLATIGLPIKITEFDLEVGDNNMSEVNQADYTAKAMRTAFAHPAVSGFVFWGFWDERHWRDEAGLFTKDKKAKSAADSVYNLIHTEWSTEGVQQVTTTIPLAFNGFYGDYTAELEYDGKKQIVDFTLDTESADTITITLKEARMSPPKLLSAVSNNANEIVLQFDKKIVTTDTSSNYFKPYNSSLIGISTLYQPTDDSTLVILELKAAINYRHFLTLSYFPGDVTDSAGTALEFIGAFDVENQNVGFISANTSAEGDSIYVIFSEAMKEPVIEDLAAFTITVDEATVDLSELGILETGSDKLYLLLNENIAFGQQVKITYEPGTIQSERDVLIEAFGPKLVTNRVLTSVDDITFDKNNIHSYFRQAEQQIVITNQGLNQQDYFISLYNMTGQKVYASRVNAGEEHFINASEYSCGVMVLRFESIDLRVQNSKKILITK